jgi:phosphatidylglycerophosphate synthase
VIEDVLQTRPGAPLSPIGALARALTVGRLAAAPVFVSLLLQVASGGPGGFSLAVFYGGVALSDFLDGRLARRAGVTSAGWGRLDATADVVFNLAGLSAAAWLGLVGAWVPAGVAILGGRFLWRSLESSGELPEDRAGKLAGVIFYALVGAVVAELVLPFSPLGPTGLARAGDAVFAYTAFALWSGRSGGKRCQESVPDRGARISSA